MDLIIPNHFILGMSLLYETLLALPQRFKAHSLPENIPQQILRRHLTGNKPQEVQCLTDNKS